MKKNTTLILSFIIHGLVGATVFMLSRFSPPSFQPPVLESSLCTLPLEVTTFAEQSQAPISKPKQDQAIVRKINKNNSVVEKKEGEREQKNQPPKVKEKKKIIKEEKKPIKEEKNKLKKSEIIESVLPAQKTPVKKVKKTPKKTQKKPKSPARDLDALFDQASNLDDTIENALVNLDERAEIGGQGQTPMTDKNSRSLYGASKIGPLAISAIDRVKQLLMHGWRVPPRAQSVKQPLVIVVKVTMNPNATVRQTQLMRSESSIHHPAFSEGFQNALEAIEPYKKQPLPIPLEAFEQWKEFVFRFSSQD